MTANATVPVDLLNPGQVFACLGFVEAAEVLLGNVVGGFDWRDENDIRFVLHADGDDSPIRVVLDFLTNATVVAQAPAGSELSTESWDVPTLMLSDRSPFPFPEPASPATLPVVMQDASGNMIHIDHWGDVERDNVKFWAGSGGYPGAALARDALELIRADNDAAHLNPFALSSTQSSSFRFDWRRDCVPIDAGFSPNKHGAVVMAGYPLVEILAAIGLTHARPKRIVKTEYQYSVLGLSDPEEGVDPILLRAALGGSRVPFPMRDFRMRLGWPGKEGQARCILDVTEETNHD